jgi:HK97 family phage portal protein
MQFSIKRLLGLESVQKRSGLVAPADWLVNSLNNVFGYQTKSGQAVNPRTAMSIASVHACIRVIADGIAGLSLKLYREGANGKEQVFSNYATVLINEPNPYQTKYDFTVYMVGALALRGNAYAFINRDANYLATGLHPINPDYVTPVLGDGQLFYKISAKGYPSVIAATDMLHFKGLCMDNPLLGVSPIVLHAETLGIDLAAISGNAGVYKNGVLKFLLTSEQQIKPEQAAPLKQSLDDVIDGASRSTVLPNGIKMERLSLSPDEAKYLETRKFDAEEIARIFGVPASMIGAKDGIKSSVEQEYQDFYARTLMSYAINIEQELARKLLTEADKVSHYFKFNFNSLLRASANDRADYYNKGIRGGWLNRNEARDLEDANPFAGGEEYLIEANLIPASKIDAYMDAKIEQLMSTADKNNNPSGTNNQTIN